MVNLHCPLDWIWHLLGDIPWGASVRMETLSVGNTRCHELGPLRKQKAKWGEAKLRHSLLFCASPSSWICSHHLPSLPQGTAFLNCMSTLPVAALKCSDKSNLKENGSFWFTVRDGEEVKVAGIRSGLSHCTHCQEAVRFLQLHSLRPQPMGWYHPDPGWVLLVQFVWLRQSLTA